MRCIIVLLALVGCKGVDGAPALGDATADGTGSDALGPVIDTPDDVLTWVPFPTTTCGNGTPAGIGVRRTHLSDDLFVFFSGGGACWDYQSCYVNSQAVHVSDTYTAELMHSEADGLVFDHSQTTNPLSKATIVYVPYCTGDLHAGNNVAHYTSGTTAKDLHHSGSTNTAQFVASLRATFPQAQHLWITGSSAGGYGATFNFHQFADAWPSAEAHLLQDSSPFVQPLVNFDAWKTNWKLQYPPGCTGCDATFPKVVDTVATAHPASRIALLHYNNDAIIRTYLGYDSLIDASNSLVDMQYSHPNTKAFMVAGESHTMFGGIGTIVGPGNVPLATWFTQWLTGDSAWTTVRP